MKYRKRPIVIDAYQTQVTLAIETLEGVMTANPGDWVITGTAGETYPCKDFVFREVYEPVESGDADDRSQPGRFDPVCQ